jgi:hypothetical protein
MAPTTDVRVEEAPGSTTMIYTQVLNDGPA